MAEGTLEDSLRACEPPTEAAVLLQLAPVSCSPANPVSH